MSIPDLTPIDPESIPSDSTPNTDGAPKKRRGRPPGSTNRTTGTRRRTAADKAQVETALATMGTLYSAASAALLVIGRPLTAEVVAGSIEQTQAANRQAFEASPALASAIAKLGAVSSVGLFIGSNVALIGSVYMAYRMETAMQREAARAAAQSNEGHQGL